jgi:catechol 2,3-dioxygenase-like lactoylglutathione lyase family enzyme
MKQLDKPVLFTATAQVEKSRAFYERVLGLTLVADEPYALVFRVGRSMLRIQKVGRVRKVPYTVLGWAVRNIRSTVRHLSEAGVIFQRYDSLVQDADGIWHSPGGALVAWFQDPDGNTLSLTQFNRLTRKSRTASK